MSGTKCNGVGIVEARANDLTDNHFGHFFRYGGTDVA